MSRTLPYFLVIVVTLGLAGYLYSTDEKIFGFGLGLILSLLIGLVALEKPRRIARAPVAAGPASSTPARVGADHAAEFSAIRAQLAELISTLNNAKPTGATHADDTSLRKAVETLAGELSAREKEASRHQDLLVQRDQKRLLARIASIRETAEFMRRAVLAGKMDVNEALNQMMLELEAAIGDTGLEVHQIAPGTCISELPAAAFIALTAEIASDPSQAGTVKEAVSDALFIQDPEGRRAYISPAKLKLYRI